MIYFRAYAYDADGQQIVAIAVVEDARRADRYVAQGYTRCTAAAFRTVW